MVQTVELLAAPLLPTAPPVMALHPPLVLALFHPIVLNQRQNDHFDNDNTGRHFLLLTYAQQLAP